MNNSNNTDTIAFELSEEDWFPLGRHKDLSTGKYIQIPVLVDTTAKKIDNIFNNPKPEEPTKTYRRNKE